ncbi:chromosome segregation protein SMC [Rhizorhabdus wittichii RW1]|uniref:Chromosome partition protein Smc n=1 Tax=Rhizorhabdus wittichii (strain DSM 6014 / CCUG 31198 / JCM 15750 / NBRC 105917 / EY 4224 / RW1) TaxID=392499 RepID=A0A9J9LGX0_RHIWR|nr:chromosome segregation protein SMC [Rhizorhabdus wittichii RW1]
MRFRKLRLSGFKSFVEPAELIIERGLTGIVGPNGCGKSNLLEAIRWVMGESSAKSMRGGGMEDVIFAGTTTRPARDFAEVTLFTERPEAEADEDREVEVTRRIERGAGSAYRMNGRDVRQKDVGLLFADAATGAHSPALVSQGRIAAVIAAKPAERRQMLEEAAGIAGLHVRRKDAEQKLRATETNLARLDDLIADMENRTASLRRQARAAERYKALSEQIRLAEARLIYSRWRDAAAAAEAARKEATAAEAAVAQATEAQRTIAEKQAEAARKVGDARQAAQTARERSTGLAHRLATLTGELESVRRRISDIAQSRDTLSRDRAREDRLAIDAAAALSALAEEEKELARRIEEATVRQSAIDGQVRDAEAEAREAELAVAKAQAAHAAEQADMRVAQANVAAARQRLDRAQAEMQRIVRELAALGDEAPLIARRTAAVAARELAERAIADAMAAIGAGEEARAAAAQRRDEAEAASGAARAALAALESEARSLEKAASAAGKGDRAIDQVRAASGYERALAAALGDDLDAAVGGEGPLRWSGAAPGDDPALPKGTERLADHVHAPAELARRLAQVAVVDDDDGSIALAAGQRLVTRDGRMRRWDGFFAADVGAAAAERLVRANRLAELQAALPGARAELEAAQAALAEANGATQAAKVAIDAARAELGRAEGTQRNAIRDEDQATTAIERLAAQQAAMAERQARAKAETDEAGALVETQMAAMLALPDGEATRAEVERLRQLSETVRARLFEARGMAMTLAQAASADAQRQQAARGEAKSWKTRAGDAANRIAEMDARAAAIETESKALEGRPEELEALIASVGADSRAAEQQAEIAREAERVAENELRAIEAGVAQAGEALAAAREARAGAQARLENQEQRRVEMGRISGERFECPAPVLPQKVGFVSDEVGEAGAESARLEQLTADRERLGPVNLVAEIELAEIEGQHATSITERDELYEAINRLRGSIGSLNREGRARLLAAFEAVNGHFRRLFTTLFGGGEAHLALIDSDDPLEAGLEIMAQPPGKNLSSLTLLSGGEQALTAVALIFGLFLTNPAPICVLDEVDAPLDDANIERFCDLLVAMTRETETRYLIVTHNAVTMSRMHRLFGVTMVERGVSRLVSVDLSGAEQLLAAE